jgi:chitodextrinase
MEGKGKGEGWPHLRATCSFPIWRLLLLFLFILPLHAARPAVPKAPSNLAASAVSSSQINLTWTDNSLNESGFKIQRAPSSSGPWGQIATTSANITSYSNTGLNPATTYFYRVTAYNSRGDSSYSSTASATTAAQTISCSYSLSSSSASAASAGGSGTLTVTAGNTCTWTPTSNAGWLTCTPSSGTGGGTITWSATANTSTSPRSGTLNIAGQSFTVNQAGASSSCTYTISPPTASLPASGGTGSVAVTAGTGCAWTATTGGLGWITITSGASGSGNGTVSYSVAANSSASPRTGTLTIAGQTFTVSQAGADSTDVALADSVPFNDSLTAATRQAGWKYYYIDIPAGLGSMVVDLTMTADVDLYVRHNAQPTLSAYDCRPYIGGTSERCTFNSPAAGRWWIGVNNYATGTINFTVKVTCATATCAYSISPTSAPTTSAGGSGSVSVSCGTGCGWTASSASSWLTCTPTGGTGAGTVTWSATANTGTSSRTGTLSIAGQTFTVTQPAAADTTAPTAQITSPTAGTTVSGTVAVNVTATDNVGVTRVDWFVNGTVVGSSPTAPATFSWNTTTAPNGSNNLQARAYDAAGNSAVSPMVGVTVQNVVPDTTAPNVPSGLTASAVSSSQINLSWTAATDSGGSGLAGYKIYRSGTQIATTASTSYSNTGLSASTSYSYTVAAYDNAGNTSAQSVAASATTQAAPDTTAPSVPTGLAASAVSSSQINLSWTAATDSGGSGLAGYKIYRNGTQIATTASTSYSNTGLSASTSYSYTVAAYDNAGNTSAQSVAASATTQAAADTTAPSIPTGLTAYAGSCSHNVITWNVSTDTGGSGLKGYNLYRNGVFLKQVAAPALTTTDTGLAASTSYAYAVAAVDNAGNESAKSAAVNATTPACPDNPPTASLTTPTSGATLSGTATFAGSATDDIGVTKVEFWCDGSVLLGTATTAPYNAAVNTTTMANGTYSFTCKAYDTTGKSTISAPITATVNNVVQPTGAWAKRFGGADSDQGKAVTRDSSGNIVVVGTFRGTIDLGGGLLTSAGLSDMFITKYSASGAHLWSKRFGGASDEQAWSVALDANGNVFVGGSFSGTTDLGGGPMSGAGGTDMFVAKYSATGTYQWAKRFGGADSDAVKSLAVDTDGNVIVTGYFSGSPVNLGGNDLYGSGGFTVFLAKYSGGDGSHIWSKNFAGGGYGDRVVIDANGEILTVGRFRGYIDCSLGWVTFPLPPTTLIGIGDDDFYLAKFRADGTHVWSKAFGGANNDIANYLAVDSAKNIYVFGAFTGSINLGAGPMTTVAISDADVFLAKFSTSGACLWSKSIAGPYGSDTAGGIAVDANGNVTISGSFNQRLDFTAFGGPVLTSASLGGFDVFAAKFSSAGGFGWAKRFGGISGDYSSDLAVDGTGAAIITGCFLGTGDFEGQTLNSAGSLDILLLRLGPQ